LGLFRPIVAPTLAEDHRDVSHLAQLHPFGIDPKGSAALTVDCGDSNRGICPARQRGHQGLEGFPIGNLPAPGKSDDVPLAQRLEQLQIGPRGVGRLGGDHGLLAPGWAPEIVQHLAK
jgi:hypothetical protein